MIIKQDSTALKGFWGLRGLAYGSDAPQIL
jgi:hypothetical protein